MNRQEKRHQKKNKVRHKIGSKNKNTLERERKKKIGSWNECVTSRYNERTMQDKNRTNKHKDTETDRIGNKNKDT